MNMNGYVIIGAGGHAKVVIDSLKMQGKEILGLTDAKYHEGMYCEGFPVVGTDECLERLFSEGVGNAAMGIGHVGNYQIRQKVYDYARHVGFSFPNIIHPAAVIADSVLPGNAGFFNAGCIVNAGAGIGDLCIVNTAAIIEHEVCLGYGVHIAPGATILGAAHIGENSFIGAGSIVLPGVHVGKRCIVGAGSIVLHDVEDDSVVAGNPARVLRRRT